MEPPPRGPCLYCETQALTKCSRCKTAFYCGRNCQKSHWKTHKRDCVESKAILQIVDEQEIDTSLLELKVEIRSSKVHGKGVFATRNILKGEKICYFGGDSQESKIRVVMQKFPGDILGIKNADEVFQAICDSHSTMDKCLASNSKDKPNEILIGHDEPLDTFGIGQFINDACKPWVQTKDFSTTLEALTQYQIDSTRKSNCEVGPKSWFVATKDIVANQELFTHYGFEFWAQKFMLDSASPVERLLFYAVMDQNRKPFDLRRFYNFTDATVRSFLKVLIQVPDVDQEDFDPKKYICQVTDQINIQAPVEIQS